MNDYNTHSMRLKSNINHIFKNSMNDVSFLAMTHSIKLHLINQFIRSKLCRQQTNYLSSTPFQPIYKPKVDYFEKLKSYYKAKCRRFNISLEGLRNFTIQRKEIKNEFTGIKQTTKGIIFSLFLGTNLLFGYKRIELIKTSPPLFINFLLLTSTVAISSNLVAQKVIKRHYRQKFNELEIMNL